MRGTGPQLPKAAYGGRTLFFLYQLSLWTGENIRWSSYRCLLKRKWATFQLHLRKLKQASDFSPTCSLVSGLKEDSMQDILTLSMWMGEKRSYLVLPAEREVPLTSPYPLSRCGTGEEIGWISHPSLLGRKGARIPKPIFVNRTVFFLLPFVSSLERRNSVGRLFAPFAV
jgi:hypothetical protein